MTWGGSLARTEATGYGLCYFTEAMLNDKQDSFKGKTVIVSGSGNVAIYAVEKATQLGARVVAMCDSAGYIYDKNGIDLDTVKNIKEVRRGRIKEYVQDHADAQYHEGTGIWSIPCDIALPCATQNELNEQDAEMLIKNGVKAVCEGANMPCTPKAIERFQTNHVLYAPGKASNAGGVAVSGLEMAWSFEEVDEKLQQIMNEIYRTVADTAKEYDMEDNFMAGANIAGFLKVAQAMMSQGIV